MARDLRILLACAVALFVIGTGGIVTLMLISSSPQAMNSQAGARVALPAHGDEHAL